MCKKMEHGDVKDLIFVLAELPINFAFLGQSCFAPLPCMYQVIRFLVVQMVKSLPVMQEIQVPSGVVKMPQRRKWQPTPVFLAWEIPWKWKSLVGHSPEGLKESDMIDIFPACITKGAG